MAQHMRFLWHGLSVPSANFPGADLRVYPDTEYTFACPECGAANAVDCGWVIRTPPISRNEPPAAIERAARGHFRSVGPGWSSFSAVACGGCGTLYVLHFAFDETCNTAFRVVMLAAASVSTANDAG